MSAYAKAHPAPSLDADLAPAQQAGLRSIDGAALSDRERHFGAARWPRNPLLGMSLSVALVIAAAAPSAALQPSADRVAAVVAVSVTAALAARLVFVAAGATPARPGAAADVGLAGVAAAAGVLIFAVVGLGLGLVVAPTALAAAWAGASVLLLLAGALRKLEVRARARTRRVFLVGTEAQRLDLMREAAGAEDVRLVGFADVADRRVEASALREELERSEATVLLLSDEAIRDDDLVSLAAECNLRGLRIRELRGFYEQEFEKVAVSELTPSWFLFDIAEIHRRRLYGRAKRLVEGTIAATLLLLTLPLLPWIALAVKLSSPGSVLFSQERVGKQGRRFRLTKFRTMHLAADGEVGEWAEASAPRIFPVGRVLRKFRLDELPQLWHVLRGDLSLVGPRPEQPAICARLERSMPFYAARHSVRPGLTGWAQVNFGYGGSDEGALTKLQYDLFYIKRQGILLDLRIVAATARAIVKGVGG